MAGSLFVGSRPIFGAGRAFYRSALADDLGARGYSIRGGSAYRGLLSAKRSRRRRSAQPEPGGLIENARLKCSTTSPSPRKENPAFNAPSLRLAGGSRPSRARELRRA